MDGVFLWNSRESGGVPRAVRSALFPQPSDESRSLRSQVPVSADQQSVMDDGKEAIQGIEPEGTGRNIFAGHAVPGRTRAFLKYNGIDQKPILTKQARKRGVKIHNRAMGYELFLDDQGRAAGVFAVGEYRAHVHRAGAVCLGSGAPNGVFPNARRGH